MRLTITSPAKRRSTLIRLLGRLNFGISKPALHLTVDGLVGALAIGFVIATPVAAQEKPATVGLGIFTFTSGPAAAYGMPGKNGADLMIEAFVMNAVLFAAAVAGFMWLLNAARRSGSLMQTGE